MKEEQAKWESLRMIAHGLIADLKLERLKKSREQVDLFESALSEYEEVREKAGWKNGNSIHVGGFKNDWRK